MGFQISAGDIEAVINCVPEAIERVLRVLQIKIERYLERGGNVSSPTRPLYSPPQAGGNKQGGGYPQQEYQQQQQQAYK